MVMEVEAEFHKLKMKNDTYSTIILLCIINIIDGRGFSSSYFCSKARLYRLNNIFDAHINFTIMIHMITILNRIIIIVIRRENIHISRGNILIDIMENGDDDNKEEVDGDDTFVDDDDEFV